MSGPKPDKKKMNCHVCGKTCKNYHGLMIHLTACHRVLRGYKETRGGRKKLQID